MEAAPDVRRTRRGGKRGRRRKENRQNGEEDPIDACVESDAEYIDDQPEDEEDQNDVFVECNAHPADDRPLHELLYGRRFHGRIKSFSEKDRYGFIESDEVHCLFEDAGQTVKDVFLHLRDQAGFQVGDFVSFAVSLSEKKQPQASELMSALGFSEFDDFASYRFQGVLKAWFEDKKYGFIKSEGVQDLLRKTNREERDVFLLASEKQEFGVGDRISFFVRLNASGQPQAFDLGPDPLFYGYPAPPVHCHGYVLPAAGWHPPPLMPYFGYPDTMQAAARPTHRSRSRSQKKARPRPSMAAHLR